MNRGHIHTGLSALSRSCRADKHQSTFGTDATVRGKNCCIKWHKLHFIVFTVHTTAKHTCHRCSCLLYCCGHVTVLELWYQFAINEAWARDAELTVSAVQINPHFYLNVKNMKWGSNKSHMCDADKISTTVSLCSSSAWTAVAAYGVWQRVSFLSGCDWVSKVQIPSLLSVIRMSVFDFCLCTLCGVFVLCPSSSPPPSGSHLLLFHKVDVGGAFDLNGLTLAVV